MVPALANFGEKGGSYMVVYHRKGCPFAAFLMLRLKMAGIAFTAARFDRDPAGAAAVAAHNPDGNLISPTVRIGEAYLPNPSLSAVRRALA